MDKETEHLAEFTTFVYWNPPLPDISNELEEKKKEEELAANAAQPKSATKT